MPHRGRGNNQPQADPSTHLADPVAGSIDNNKWYTVRMSVENRHLQAWRESKGIFNIEVASSLHSRNSFAKPEVVNMKTSPADVARSNVKFTLPPYSAAVVVVAK